MPTKSREESIPSCAPKVAITDIRARRIDAGTVAFCPSTRKWCVREALGAGGLKRKGFRREMTYELGQTTRNLGPEGISTRQSAGLDLVQTSVVQLATGYPLATKVFAGYVSILLWREQNSSKSLRTERPGARVRGRGTLSILSNHMFHLLGNTVDSSCLQTSLSRSIPSSQPATSLLPTDNSWPFLSRPSPVWS